ncbi:MAG: hypothetical protein EA402_10295 [Planctomycetota bacterium]|nr:MAG: hypothetical protein EA402_10295 [Planctomycetota bacterium]
MPICGRFAPSTTGDAHPGTLLAGLLCWLDLRRQGGRAILRLEDLDPERCSPAKTTALWEQLRWFGLDDWDVVERQSRHSSRHHRALHQLSEAGLLYACSCTRSQLRQHARRREDGSLIYPGTCRDRRISRLEDAMAIPPLRCYLEGSYELGDESVGRLAGDLSRDCGDPIVLRRDGGVAYQLASVVDDAAQGVNRIVRGRDLWLSTPIQSALAERLGLALPSYRHHLLLLQAEGDKLSKFHAAVGVPELARHYQPTALCGWLAWVAGLQSDPAPCRPADLIPDFTWSRVRSSDQIVAWNGSQLQHLGAVA